LANQAVFSNVWVFCLGSGFCLFVFCLSSCWRNANLAGGFAGRLGLGLLFMDLLDLQISADHSVLHF